MLDYIDEFEELYNKRPIIDNSGGTNSSHLFPTFVYCKEKKPKLIIESGIWKGQGTWLFEKASNAKIISFDINLNNLQYRSDRATYLQQDIMTSNIDDYIKDYHPDDILIFLDDHQDFNKRLGFFLDKGIKHIIYEDNYPPEHGDCLSVKKIISGDRQIEESNREKIIDCIEHYEESPPLFDSEKNRFGESWYLYETRKPLLDCDLKEKYLQFYNDRLGYTWLAYIRLKNRK